MKSRQFFSITTLAIIVISTAFVASIEYWRIIAIRDAELKAYELLQKPVYLNFEGTSHAPTLADIGVVVDKETTALTIDKQKLAEYIGKLENEFQYIKTNTIISMEDFSFRAPGDKATIVIDPAQFASKEKLMALVNAGTPKIALKLSTLDSPDTQKTKLDTITRKITAPLLIKYGRTPLTISSDTLSGFIVVESKNDVLSGIVDYLRVSKYLDDLQPKNGSPDVVIKHKESADAIRRALLFRAADYQVNNAIMLPLEGKPKTDGTLHDIYLEVVKSQQRLYRFEHGKLVKTYVISTGLTLETPVGDYKILGKDRMAISYTGGWYMPNYLPIGYINGSLRFGFHEIPYHMDGNGNIYSRDPNTMGSPATGGCIQLEHNDSIELFDWAQVGIPVYVYE